MKPVLAVIAAAIALAPAARLLDAYAAASSVTSLSVLPGSGRADVVIGVAGGVEVQDFTLRSPDRIVLDLTGASLGLLPKGYDHVARGGITDVRYSNYKKNMVRVVLYLDGPRAYQLSRESGAVRIGVTTEPGARFGAWHIGRPLAAREPVVAAGEVRSGPARSASGVPASAEPSPRLV
ncbi:MAG: AMIN domain-containing protein, partial [Gemmatimonadaceae bacterium]|nr:AMIN domain-containing protein [Gemmatimonadaceae bacterium]